MKGKKKFLNIILVNKKMKTYEQTKKLIGKAFEYQKEKDIYILNDIARTEDFLNFLFEENFEVRNHCYEWGSELFNEIYDFLNSEDCKDITELQKLVSEMEINDEASPYTRELTKWLADNVEHTYYLTEVLETRETKDGFELLNLAQSLHKREVKESIKQALLKWIEN